MFSISFVMMTDTFLGSAVHFGVKVRGNHCQTAINIQRIPGIHFCCCKPRGKLFLTGSHSIYFRLVVFTVSFTTTDNFLMNG